MADLNRRPSDPQPDALANCANARFENKAYYKIRL